MKCIRLIEWKWEIKRSDCAMLIWVFRGIRVPIRLDQAWRSKSLLHGSGCSGTECWLLAETGEAASLCLDQTYLFSGLKGEGPWTSFLLQLPSHLLNVLIIQRSLPSLCSRSLKSPPEFLEIYRWGRVQRTDCVECKSLFISIVPEGRDVLCFYS